MLRCARREQDQKDVVGWIEDVEGDQQLQNQAVSLSEVWCVQTLVEQESDHDESD